MMPQCRQARFCFAAVGFFMMGTIPLAVCSIAAAPALRVPWLPPWPPSKAAPRRPPPPAQAVSINVQTHGSAPAYVSHWSGPSIHSHDGLCCMLAFHTAAATKDRSHKRQKRPRRTPSVCFSRCEGWMRTCRRSLSAASPGGRSRVQHGRLARRALQRQAIIRAAVVVRHAAEGVHDHVVHLPHVLHWHIACHRLSSANVASTQAGSQKTN